MNINNKLRLHIHRRKTNKETKFPIDIPPLIRRIYSNRGICNINEIKRSIREIIPWQSLLGIEKAISMLYEAIREKIKIVVVGDFDTDGATSIALIVLSLKEFGHDNIAYLVPNRFKDGYGLSPEIVDQAYNNYGAQMIMTVDNGISSHAGVDRANQLGIPLLVTDHHLPDNVLPKAEVIINPNLHNCNFPSKSLSGVGVAFYLMVAFRAFLRDKGWFEKQNIVIPNLAKYLDLVALGTVADMVPLDSNNRILIWQGLNRIRAGKCRPGIKALLKLANRNSQQLTTNDLSFVVGPRINAAGRIKDMSIGVSLLLCETYVEAQELANMLNNLNQIRKKIEKDMHIEALKLCETLKQDKLNMLRSIILYQPNWHQGVVGILAANIKDQFNLPVIAFASAGNGNIKGSGRSINGLHIRNVLEKFNMLHPGLILKFGGHEMAIGVLLKEINFKKFQYYFNELITELLDPSLLKKEIFSDGPLRPDEMTIEIAQMLIDAGPWGQMFPEPLFDGYFFLLKQRLVNNSHLKVVVKSVDGGPILSGIMFNIDTSSWPNNSVHEVELAYKLYINEFYGSRFLQIIIDNIWPIQ